MSGRWEDEIVVARKRALVFLSSRCIKPCYTVIVKRDEAADPAPANPSPAPASNRDVALICGATSDGQGVQVVRCRDGALSAGEVRPLVQGQPIHGEVVRLKPRSETPRVCDVEVEYAPAAPPGRTRKGPVQVASDVYRNNWDLIFKPKSELAN